MTEAECFKEGGAGMSSEQNWNDIPTPGDMVTYLGQSPWIKNAIARIAVAIAEDDDDDLIKIQEAISHVAYRLQCVQVAYPRHRCGDYQALVKVLAPVQLEMKNQDGLWGIAERLRYNPSEALMCLIELLRYTENEGRPSCDDLKRYSTGVPRRILDASGGVFWPFPDELGFRSSPCVDEVKDKEAVR